MVISESDISIVYSGGVSNSDPDASLGGDASVFPITDDINNLFDDVASEESSFGAIDFRAFYIFNDHATDTLYNVRVWIESQIADGATAELGIPVINEQQSIAITPFNDITGGSFTLQFDTEITASIAWDGDTSTLAANIQTALRNLPSLSAVIVTYQASDDTFLVNFSGADGGRNQPTLAVDTNSLTSSGDPADIAVSVITEGSPINVAALDIGLEANPPTGVSFVSALTEDNAISIGSLHAADGFYVWVKRTTPPDTEGVPLDGFTFRIKGDTLP